MRPSSSISAFSQTRFCLATLALRGGFLAFFLANASASNPASALVHAPISSPLSLARALGALGVFVVEAVHAPRSSPLSLARALGGFDKPEFRLLLLKEVPEFRFVFFLPEAALPCGMAIFNFPVFFSDFEISLAKPSIERPSSNPGREERRLGAAFFISFDTFDLPSTKLRAIRWSGMMSCFPLRISSSPLAVLIRIVVGLSIIV